MWENDQVRIEPNLSVIFRNVENDPKLIYFAQTSENAVLWPAVPCKVTNVATRPYFKVSSQVTPI